MTYGQETSNKCFIIPAHDIRARWTLQVFNGFYVTLTCELRNVRYANYSPVYHSISSFDHTFEMACSTCNIQRQITIKGWLGNIIFQI